MAKAKKSKEKGIVSKFKAMDSLSKSFLVGFVVAGVVMTSVSVNFVYRNNQAYLSDMEYEDPSVNFVLVPPKGWSTTTPSRSNVEKTIIETTKGGKFDVTKYALTDEIVPIVLVENANGSERKGVSGSSYISVALRGYNSSNDRLYDKKYCEEYLGLLLEELNSKNIKYTNTESIKRGNFNGTLVEAEATDKGVKVYYVQYQEIIGDNVLTLTFGTTNSNLNGKDYINDTLKHLKFKILTDDEFMSDVLSSQFEDSSNSVTDEFGESSDTSNNEGWNPKDKSDS